MKTISSTILMLGLHGCLSIHMYYVHIVFGLCQRGGLRLVNVASRVGNYFYKTALPTIGEGDD